MKTNIYIINKNYLSTLKNMIDFLSKEDRIKITVVDNGSTYVPLLNYYKSDHFQKRAELVNFTDDENYKVVWDKQLTPDEPYFVTDSDLDLSLFPTDWYDRFFYYLYKYPEVDKIGAALKIDDIPYENPLRSQIVDHEFNFWKYPVEYNLFNSPTDTTFALYQARIKEHTLKAFRTSICIAKHIPWYITPSNITDEQIYYFNHISNNIQNSHWSRQILNNKKTLNKILIETKTGGSDKYRITDPHNKLKDNFDITYNPKITYTEEYLKNFDAIFIHRLPNVELPKILETINLLKKLDIKVIVDYDDDIYIDRSHSMYQFYTHNKIPQLSIEMIKIADLVITTTKILRDKLIKINPNTIIIPNAVNTAEPQFQIKKTHSDKVRFIWAGGSSHIEDIKLLSHFGNINMENRQIILAGYNTNGYNKITDQYGRVIQIPHKKEELIYRKYENILTNNHKYLSEEFNNILDKHDEILELPYVNESYRRIWTKPVDEYAKAYNIADVSLAPLCDNNFNKYKSQLKVIEAGFFHLPILCSDVAPYQVDIINKVNGFLIRKERDFTKYAKQLIESESMRIDMGEKLYETVSVKYNLDNVTKYRLEIYNELLKNPY